MHEEHRANPKNTRRKQKKKPIHRLITKRKRANERRERITSCELGCTDTPFLASCRCRTRIGHRNGYDSPDSSVRRVSSFLFFFFQVWQAWKPRLHGHAIFGVVSVSDTCRTSERVRRAGFRCPAVSLFFFFFSILRHGADTAPTRRQLGSDASDTPAVKKKKENFGIFRVIPAISAEMKISSDTRFWPEKKKKKSKSYLLLGFVLFFLLFFFLISVSSSSSSFSSSSFGFGQPDDLFFFICVSWLSSTCV